MTEKLDPIPPGEILLEEFMRPHALSQNKLARDLDVPVARINDIIRGVASLQTRPSDWPRISAPRLSSG